MRLVTYEEGDGVDRVGYVLGDRIVDLGALIGGYDRPDAKGPMRRLLARWDEVRDTLPGPADAPGAALADVRLRPPVTDPTKVVAAPVNYRDHRTEMEMTVDVSDLAVFLKAPSSVIPHGGVVRLPYTDRRVDQEGELAAVIGRRACNVAEADALSYVAGYTGCLDITMRGKEDRSTRKSFDTFTPLGPWLVTTDEADPADDIDLDCTVAGEHRQKTNTKNLIWGVAKLISYISSVMTLEVGDVIATGTPAGVGPIVAGDEIALTLSSIGTLAVTVAAAQGAGPSPTGTRGR
ncbi:fumarylacetoacetate hydrolase family protein [Pseudonocardia spinosispora]|uniref:fumarylacetoacetate hydrolase family protein n=1 Tax=Pseudonocardia spinosispora TaxID=103441 RepID=UPI0003F4E4AC|nr:fumarylacetoacetate hydrolase family protein [Pseudonocardia spinosispora]